MKPYEQPEKHSERPHYEGVARAVRKDGSVYYRASMTFRRKHISLGSFACAETAHEAYLEGLGLINSPGQSLNSYTSDSLLAFEKWVSILNFRDNNIYFGNPIYVGQRLFYYYLSPSHVLKFDLDDLFYYASHKIMCRGNHYFVADYGLQVSISSRYGIKPYAKLGKDFRFINNDPTDFRRENLQILNIYHGVACERKKSGQYIYTARIHIRGNYIIGRYQSEQEAAIAYNKAIDILKKNGVAKKYTANYIDGISPSRYAQIYTDIAISQKIIDYRPPISPHNR